MNRKEQVFITVASLATVFFIIMLMTGCTEAERRGYSSIPQSSPASWEVNPYGNFRN